MERAWTGTESENQRRKERRGIEQQQRVWDLLEAWEKQRGWSWEGLVQRKLN
jgi:hypothetical protein